MQKLTKDAKFNNIINANRNFLINSKSNKFNLKQTSPTFIANSFKTLKYRRLSLNNENIIESCKKGIQFSALDE